MNFFAHSLQIQYDPWQRNFASSLHFHVHVSLYLKVIWLIVFISALSLFCMYNEHPATQALTPENVQLSHAKFIFRDLSVELHRNLSGRINLIKGIEYIECLVLCNDCMTHNFTQPAEHVWYYKIGKAEKSTSDEAIWLTWVCVRPSPILEKNNIKLKYDQFIAPLVIWCFVILVQILICLFCINSHLKLISISVSCFMPLIKYG